MIRLSFSTNLKRKNYPPFVEAYPKVATSVIVARFTILACAAASFSVGVGEHDDNWARNAMAEEIMKTFIVTVETLDYVLSIRLVLNRIESWFIYTS